MMGQFVMVMLYLWIIFVILVTLVIMWNRKK
jgi:hypothetical protein